ncbi:class IV adenylate cyclase [Salisaeta longa]|uniref:class IV adenylate cyclase n=1 Tax=Salisaeta longa TaxID=503170 RepID=UPI0003B6CF0B|nr:class IV adenylate cyclase [Salisaeta longa]
MHHINVEIKARCNDLAQPRAYLEHAGARFVGEDHQVDTYFRNETGRLKLREGTIETNLIYYQRADRAGPKSSDVHRMQPEDPAALKAVLSAALGVWVVVDKRRAIYFIDNVKFHLDRVHGLGTFVEIEATAETSTADPATLRAQCQQHLDALGIADDQLVAASYSDLVASTTE